MILNILRKTLATASMVGLLATSAVSMPLAIPQAAPSVGAVIPVAGDCHAIGMQQAAQMGGQLARATPEVRGGQQVCVIVVLMPARDGQRPRRSEIVVPLG
ncbi:hypothetical protein [Mesorhizobium sp. CAU 1741]|uniref:hypothetical protein n=1 Tax=Mesorhizobium sp. CAU 1741 TaxID=3140366 RepID=UPI00325AB418